MRSRVTVLTPLLTCPELRVMARHIYPAKELLGVDSAMWSRGAGPAVSDPAVSGPDVLLKVCTCILDLV